MDFDSCENVATNQSCRVCGDDGVFDLWEMKFRYDDEDVMLIEAFNSFSTIDNNLKKIFLCETCTDSLTMAYTFWQQVKHSDERLVKESINKADATTIELVNLAESDESLDAREKLQKSRMVSKLTDDGGTNKNSSGVKPAKRKIRKNLPKTDEPPPLPANQIGVNIGLPHFIVTDNLSDDETISGCGRMDGITDNDRAETESHLKKIKTLTPSAIIPDNLDKINDLCMEPSEVGGDGGLSIYKCTYCPKAFAAPYHLMLHMRKSHVCQYCLSTFSKINDLYDHVKETHKTFSCLLCSKEFKSNGNLRQHIRKNHSIHLPAHISLLNLCDLPH